MALKIVWKCSLIGARFAITFTLTRRHRAEGHDAKLATFHYDGICVSKEKTDERTEADAVCSFCNTPDTCASAYPPGDRFGCTWDCKYNAEGRDVLVSRMDIPIAEPEAQFRTEAEQVVAFSDSDGDEIRFVLNLKERCVRYELNEVPQGTTPQGIQWVLDRAYISRWQDHLGGLAFALKDGSPVLKRKGFVVPRDDVKDVLVGLHSFQNQLKGTGVTWNFLDEVKNSSTGWDDGWTYINVQLSRPQVCPVTVMAAAATSSAARPADATHRAAAAAAAPITQPLEKPDGWIQLQQETKMKFNWKRLENAQPPLTELRKASGTYGQMYVRGNLAYKKPLDTLGWHSTLRSVQGTALAMKVGFEGWTHHLQVPLRFFNPVDGSNYCWEELYRAFAFPNDLASRTDLRTGFDLPTAFSPIPRAVFFKSGMTLADSLERSGRYTPEDARKSTEDMLDALAFLEENDRVHLDVKPENVMHDTNERKSAIRLIDFDLMSLKKDLGHNLELAMTRWYRSPEIHEYQGKLRKLRQEYQAKLKSEHKGDTANANFHFPEWDPDTGDVPDGHKGDVFSVGCVLFEMLTGKPLFNSPSAYSHQEVLKKGFSSLTERFSKLGFNDELKDFLWKTLAENPEKRWTAKALQSHAWIQKRKGS